MAAKALALDFKVSGHQPAPDFWGLRRPLVDVHPFRRNCRFFRHSQALLDRAELVQADAPHVRDLFLASNVYACLLIHVFDRTLLVDNCSDSCLFTLSEPYRQILLSASPLLFSAFATTAILLHVVALHLLEDELAPAVAAALEAAPSPDTSCMASSLAASSIFRLVQSTSSNYFAMNSSSRFRSVINLGSLFSSASILERQASV